MGRYGLQIHKWDSAGNLVVVHTSLLATISKERVCQVRLYTAMEQGTLYKGHYWTRTADKPVIRDGVNVNVISSLQHFREHVGHPWEGRDGMFDIAGWGRLMREQDFHTNKSPRVVQREWHVPAKSSFRKKRA